MSSGLFKNNVTFKLFVYKSYILSSLASSCTNSTDFPDTLSPFISVGLPNYILCRHRANVNKFLLVSQCWHIYV